MRRRMRGRIVLTEHFLSLGVEHVQADAGVQNGAAYLNGRMKYVKALYELLKHVLFDVGPVCV